MNPDQSFHSLWEGYLFKVASLVIDSISPIEQPNLINLIYPAGHAAPEDTGPSEDGYADSNNLVGSPSAQLVA